MKKTVTLQLFAFFREKVGTDQLAVPLESKETVEDLYFWLMKQYPQSRFPLKNLRFAVNGEYVSKEHVVFAGDEVALIPPVAGG